MAECRGVRVTRQHPRIRACSVSDRRSRSAGARARVRCGRRRYRAAAAPCSSRPAPTCKASTRCSRCIRWPGRCSAMCCSRRSSATTARSIPRPYLARAWRWSPDRRQLAFRPARRRRAGTTAAPPPRGTSRGRSTPPAIPPPGYPRPRRAGRARVDVRAPTTPPCVLRFRAPQPGFPDVLTDLAILPAHLLRTPSRMTGLRRGGLERGAGGQRTVPIRRATSPTGAGCSPPTGFSRGARRAAKAGAVDSGGRGRAHHKARGAHVAASSTLPGSSRPTPSSSAATRALAVLDYPLLFTYGIVFNTRRPPFDRLGRAPRDRRGDRSAGDRGRLSVRLRHPGARARCRRDVPGYLPVAPAVDPQRSARRPRRASAFELLTVGSGEAPLEQMVQARLGARGLRRPHPAARALRVPRPGLRPRARLRRGRARHSGRSGARLSSPARGAGRLARRGRILPRRSALFADSMPVAFSITRAGCRG